jgi:sec-independent protein translocase protein TatB
MLKANNQACSGCTDRSRVDRHGAKRFRIAPIHGGVAALSHFGCGLEPADSRKIRSGKNRSIDFYCNAGVTVDQKSLYGSTDRRFDRSLRKFVSGLRGQVSLLSMGTPPTIQFASLGMADSLILMVLALVVFGPRRLPQIGRQIGKLMYEFRKASNDFKFQMEEELRNAEDADRRKQEEERLRALALAPPQPAIIPPSLTDAAAPAIPATTASPDSDEVVSPAQTAPGDETYPRIQPPSTGEQIPASRPWSPEEELAKVSNTPATPEANVEADAGAGEIPVEGHSDATTPTPEQASHG